MNKKKKNIIIFTIVALIVGTIILFFSKEEKEQENKGPTGPETAVSKIQDIEVSGILFSNIKVVNQDKYTVVSMNIVNNNDYTINIGEFVTKIYKDDNLLTTLKPYIEKDIKAKASKEIKVSKKELYSDITSVEIELPNLKIIE